MYIKVRIKTGQESEKVLPQSANHFLVSLKERPGGNVVNERLIEIFQHRYKTKHVRIVSGGQHPLKMLSVGMQ